MLQLSPLTLNPSPLVGEGQADGSWLPSPSLGEGLVVRVKPATGSVS